MAMLGVFWCYSGRLYSFMDDEEVVSELCGFKDSSRTHEDEWDKFCLIKPELRPFGYEEIPKGRVLKNCTTGKYYVYANSAFLNDSALRKKIIAGFFLIVTERFLWGTFITRSWTTFPLGCRATATSMCSTAKRLNQPVHKGSAILPAGSDS